MNESNLDIKFIEEMFLQIEKESANPEFLLGFEILLFFSLLIFGVIIYKLFAEPSKNILISLSKDNIWKKMAFGIMTIMIVPILSFILIISFVGIPLAFALISLLVIGLMVSKVFASVLIGYFLSGKIKPQESSYKYFAANFILGYLILEILSAAPALGWLTVFLIVIWAFGGVSEYAYNGLKRKF